MFSLYVERNSTLYVTIQLGPIHICGTCHTTLDMTSHSPLFCNVQIGVTLKSCLHYFGATFAATLVQRVLHQSCFKVALKIVRLWRRANVNGALF